MAATLAKEIDAFERQLSAIRQKCGSAWAVIVGDDFQGGFPSFDAAATFAVQNFGNRKFLIRHTDEHRAYIPFVAVKD